LKKIINDELWTESNIPSFSQEIVNQIINVKIEELSQKPVKEIYELFEIVGKEEKEPKPMLEINKSSYKVLNCTNEWIKFVHDSIKMIALFDISKLDMILQQVNYII